MMGCLQDEQQFNRENSRSRSATLIHLLRMETTFYITLTKYEYVLSCECVCLLQCTMYGAVWLLAVLHRWPVQQWSVQQRLIQCSDWCSRGWCDERCAVWCSISATVVGVPSGVLYAWCSNSAAVVGTTVSVRNNN